GTIPSAYSTVHSAVFARPCFFIQEIFVRKLVSIVLVAFAARLAVPQAGAEQPGKIESRYKEVNGVRLHYLIAGKGEPVLLLHGYAQTSHMWLPLIPQLAKTH